MIQFRVIDMTKEKFISLDEEWTSNGYQNQSKSFKNDNQGLKVQNWEEIVFWCQNHNELIIWYHQCDTKERETLFPSKMIIKVCERNYIASLKATTKLSHFIWYDQRGVGEKTNQCRPKESSKLPSNIVNTLTNAHFGHFGHCHGHHLMTISS